MGKTGPQIWQSHRAPFAVLTEANCAHYLSKRQSHSYTHKSNCSEPSSSQRWATSLRNQDVRSSPDETADSGGPGSISHGRKLNANAQQRGPPPVDEPDGSFVPACAPGCCCNSCTGWCHFKVWLHEHRYIVVPAVSILSLNPLSHASKIMTGPLGGLYILPIARITDLGAFYQPHDISTCMT